VFRALGLLVAALLAACAPEPAEEAFDVLIVNGAVYDGSLEPAQRRNIGVSDGRIVSVDALADAPAHTIIDAAGEMVVPGFIDPHTHAPIDPDDTQATAHANFLTQGVTTVVVGNDGHGIDNREAIFDRLEASGIGANIAFYAGHGSIRAAVMGYADRAPDPDELLAMQSLLADEMRAGALGLSTGLFYAPGSYSDTDEIVALARTAAQAGGVYDTHLRDESSYTVGLVAAVEEAVRIARDANIHVHISHIKALGKDVWGMSSDIIAIVDTARAAGLQVTANQYPWTASNVGLSSALVPRWAMEGSTEEMHARLRDPALQTQIHDEMRDNLERRGGPQAMLITTTTSSYQGMTLADAADRMGSDVIDAAIELVISESPSIASFIMHQDDIDEIARQPWVMTGSDGGRGHPRFFATYPKAWQDFVVDRRLMSAERFVHRSSGQVADSLGISNRGYIRPGYAADIAIIDADKFAPIATYEQPAELSTGVEHLLVNGVHVISSGSSQNERAGLILKRNASGSDK